MPIQIHRKFKLLQNTPKSQKYIPMAPKKDFGRFGDLFWHQFSLYFTTPRKLIFCKNYNAKTSFYQFRPPILASKTNQTIMFFIQPTSWTSFLSFLFDLFRKWSILRPRSKSSGRKNGTLNRPSGAKLAKEYMCFCGPGGFLFATCFS